MNYLKPAFGPLATVVLFASAWIATGRADGARLVYPETKKVDVVDDYFGTKVADPYRWLEDDKSPEVESWVEAENKVTFAYLDQIPYRAQLKARLEKLYNYPKFTAPTRRGDWFISSKNDGLQNQYVYYIQNGLDGAPELLLDPNKFSKDVTSRCVCAVGDGQACRLRHLAGRLGLE